MKLVGLTGKCLEFSIHVEATWVLWFKKLAEIVIVIVNFLGKAHFKLLSSSLSLTLSPKLLLLIKEPFCFVTKIQLQLGVENILWV